MATDEARSDDLAAAQDRAIALLSNAFAHDALGVDEFERRLDLVHRAPSVADVHRTVSDLASPVPGDGQGSAATAIVLADAAATAAADRVLAVFGGVERRGPWTVPRHLRVVAVAGGVVLDFRDAALAPGVTEIEVRAVIGGVQILVPPGLPVDVSGAAIFGGFGHLERMPARFDPNRPALRVRGLAVFGGVSVETRLPGESDADAHRHRAHRLGSGQPHRLPERAGS